MKRNDIFQTITFLIILLLNLSCNTQGTSGGNADKIKSSKINAVQADKNINAKLKFTTGVVSILEDSKGNFWFGSHNEGVCLFDGKSFTYFTDKDGLSDNQIRSIQEDIDGNIWFGTANGVSYYNGKKIINRTPKKNISTYGIFQNEWLKSDNDLWFNAGINAGVYRYNGKEIHYLAFPKPKTINPDNAYLVTGISEGKDNRVWFATYAGVFGYNGNKFTIINDETLGLEKGTRQLHIRSILEDSKGNLWIGNNGIGVLVKKGDTIINFSEKKGLIQSNTLNGGDLSPPGTLEHVFAITEDNFGNIWFGDRDTGLWKYDGKSMINYTIKDDLLPPAKLSMLPIGCIYLGKKGELLLGIGGEGVYIFNGKSFERKF